MQAYYYISIQKSQFEFAVSSKLRSLQQKSFFSLFSRSKSKNVSRAFSSSIKAMAQNYKYVFLGGGNAGGYAAKQYVALGGEAGQLAIITDEPVVAYERPALSKAYLAPENPARLPGFHTCVGGGGERQTPEWYTEKGIAYLTSTKIAAVDTTAKKLTTAAGEEISYEKLIIGTGARTVSLADFKTPGSELKGLHYLRNVEDADALNIAIAETKAAGGKAVCIGGGYIGMECAAALAVNGLDVTMVFPEDRIMFRLFDPKLASFYETFYASKGIKIIKGVVAESFRGNANGSVTTTVLKNGVELESSLVVVGVGARPNVELFKGQLELLEGPPGGVKVDSKLRASVPDVWSVGDVAAFPQKREGGKHTRQEHVQNCRESATYAVSDMLGQPISEEYDYLPFFYSRVFNLSWQFYGLSTGSPIHFGDFAEGKFGAFWFDNGRVVGAFLESGTPEEFAAIKKVALEQPEAPADLETQGLAFLASKL
jgi:monodehydroascorbate reductase (NADH)